MLHSCQFLLIPVIHIASTGSSLVNSLITNTISGHTILTVYYGQNSVHTTKTKETLTSSLVTPVASENSAMTSYSIQPSIFTTSSNMINSWSFSKSSSSFFYSTLTSIAREPPDLHTSTYIDILQNTAPSTKLTLVQSERAFTSSSKITLLGYTLNERKTSVHALSYDSTQIFKRSSTSTYPSTLYSSEATSTIHYISLGSPSANSVNKNSSTSTSEPMMLHSYSYLTYIESFLTDSSTTTKISSSV